MLISVQQPMPAIKSLASMRVHNYQYHANTLGLRVAHVKFPKLNYYTKGVYREEGMQLHTQRNS